MEQPAPPQASEKEAETQEADQRSAPSGTVIYKAILNEGEHELQRSSAALAWSGLAAGLSMGFSIIAEALLRHYLPDAPWRPLVAKLGYSMGFLVVILGRQQLFTENTLTPMLPLLQHPTLVTLRNVARLWGIVLATNLVGACLVALAMMHTSTFEPALQAEFTAIGREALEPGFGTTLLRGLFAGWLIALMVWLLPFAETARVWVIILITYLVGVAKFSHIIAGSVETFAVAWAGEAGWGTVLGTFIVPALLGNIVGGVLLVAVLNHGQVVAGEEA